MGGQMNDFELIKIVESHPILYDKDQARGQKNAELKDKAWREVSQEMGASERACITRWKSIRDRFGKEYRRVQEHPDEPTTWDVFPELLFLKNHYKHGHAKNDVLVDIKYTPKERKSRKVCSAEEDESHNEDDIDPDELMTNQQLIELVKRHPVLYDKHKIRDSKNLTAKNDAWKDISDTLGISEEICYKRWKKLRDRFAREYRYKKIAPQKPVIWVYFQDLLFLEEHYRKGVPLNVQTLKRRNIPNTDQSYWGDDYSQDCSNLKEEMDEEEMAESTDIFTDTIQTHSMDELLIIPVRETTTQIVPTCSGTQAISATENEETEEKLTNVISNIEIVLRESQDCLKALQHQNQRHKNELESNTWNTQPDMVQKMHVLLHGLPFGDRNKAERKILQFLCECQIKTLNNEDVEDVSNFEIY